MRREGAATQARARPTAPRGSQGAHRLHGGGHVVVALRLLRQSRPLQQLLSVPHVARDSASPRAPEPPACTLARSPACPSASRLPPRPPPRTRTGSPAGGRLQAAPPLAPSRWLAAHTVASAAEPPREDRGRRGRVGGRAGGEGGRDHACAVGVARGEAREGGGAAQP